MAPQETQSKKNVAFSPPPADDNEPVGAVPRDLTPSPTNRMQTMNQNDVPGTQDGEHISPDDLLASLAQAAAMLAAGATGARATGNSSAEALGPAMRPTTNSHDAGTKDMIDPLFRVPSVPAIDPRALTIVPPARPASALSISSTVSLQGFSPSIRKMLRTIRFYLEEEDVAAAFLAANEADLLVLNIWHDEACARRAARVAQKAPADKVAAIASVFPTLLPLVDPKKRQVLVLIKAYTPENFDEACAFAAEADADEELMELFREASERKHNIANSVPYSSTLATHTLPATPPHNAILHQPTPSPAAPSRPAFLDNTGNGDLAPPAGSSALAKRVVLHVRPPATIEEEDDEDEDSSRSGGTGTRDDDDEYVEENEDNEETEDLQKQTRRGVWATLSQDVDEFDSQHEDQQVYEDLNLDEEEAAPKPPVSDALRKSPFHASARSWAAAQAPLRPPAPSSPSTQLDMLENAMLENAMLENAEASRGNARPPADSPQAGPSSHSARNEPSGRAPRPPRVHPDGITPEDQVAYSRGWFEAIVNEIHRLAEYSEGTSSQVMDLLHMNCSDHVKRHSIWNTWQRFWSLRVDDNYPPHEEVRLKYRGVPCAEARKQYEEEYGLPALVKLLTDFALAYPSSTSEETVGMHEAMYRHVVDDMTVRASYLSRVHRIETATLITNCDPRYPGTVAQCISSPNAILFDARMSGAMGQEVRQAFHIHTLYTESERLRANATTVAHYDAIYNPRDAPRFDRAPDLPDPAEYGDPLFMNARDLLFTIRRYLKAMCDAVQDSLWPEQHFVTKSTSPMKCYNSLPPAFVTSRLMMGDWPWPCPAPCSSNISSGKGMPLLAPESRVLLTACSVRPCSIRILPARDATPEEAADSRFVDISGRPPAFVVWESTVIDDVDHPMYGERYLLFDNLTTNCDGRVLRIFTGVTKPNGDETHRAISETANPAFRKARRAAPATSTVAAASHGAGPSGKKFRDTRARAAGKKNPGYDEVESQDEGDFNEGVAPPPPNGAPDGAAGAANDLDTGAGGAEQDGEVLSSEDEDDEPFVRKKLLKSTSSATRRRPSGSKNVAGAEGKAPRKQPTAARKSPSKLKGKPLVTVVEDVPAVATPPADATTRSKRRSQAEIYGTVGTRELPDRQRGASASPRKLLTTRDAATPAPAESSTRAAKRKRNADDEDDAVMPAPAPADSSKRGGKRNTATPAAPPAPTESSTRAAKRKRADEEPEPGNEDDTQPGPAKRTKKKEPVVSKNTDKPTLKGKKDKKDKKDKKQERAVTFATQQHVPVPDKTAPAPETEATVPPPAGNASGSAPPPPAAPSLLPGAPLNPGASNTTPAPVPIVREQRPTEPGFEIPESLHRQFGLMWQLFYTAWNKGATPSGMTTRHLKEGEAAWPNAIPRPDALDQLLVDMADLAQ